MLWYGSLRTIHPQYFTYSGISWECYAQFFASILSAKCFDMVIFIIPVWLASSISPILVFLKGLFPVFSCFGMVALAVQFYSKQYPSRDTLSFWLYGFPPIYLQYYTYSCDSWRGYIRLFSYLNLSIHFFMYIFYLYDLSPFCPQY